MHVRTSSVGTWEVFILPRRRTGAARAEGGFRIRWCTERRSRMRQEYGAANKGAKARGAAGGKGLNQGEFARPKHVPGAGSGERVTGGRADTASCNEKAAGKLTALLHHITTDALRCAFYDLKKTASAGVDGLVRRGTRTDCGCSTCTDAYTRERIGRCRRGGYEIPKPERRDATARHCRPGRQDCPKGGSGCHPDADLRAGISRVQLWVPAGARGA